MQALVGVLVPRHGPEGPMKLFRAVRDGLLDDELLDVLETGNVRWVLADALSEPCAFQVLHELQGPLLRKALQEDWVIDDD
eukprot:CAMPEP_0170586610 /NCGR_PEP_ID=MMETSP0224-20130122/9836_1 /TAXON_ID=285029 /ORGANISM="Togula jolla, Strain CCCM 725" /LENGTH=80 /DNA_ID=CAMNT_0010910167 /DNA_START=414 /DNA_END=656 /DNA_ORIENTATION=+